MSEGRLPLTGTPERGAIARGPRNAIVRWSVSANPRFIDSTRNSPLSPTLSPEYREEGVISDPFPRIFVDVQPSVVVDVDALVVRAVEAEVERAIEALVVAAIGAAAGAEAEGVAADGFVPFPAVVRA